MLRIVETGCRRFGEISLASQEVLREWVEIWNSVSLLDNVIHSLNKLVILVILTAFAVRLRGRYQVRLPESGFQPVRAILEIQELV
jgi:hypothetical protein